MTVYVISYDDSWGFTSSVIKPNALKEMNTSQT